MFARMYPLEHLGEAQRQPAVVHGLEDRVCVFVGVRLDLDEVHALAEPVDEVGQRAAGDLLREVVADVVEAADDVLHRLAGAGRIEDFSVEEPVHAGRPVLDGEVEAPGAVLLAEDQRLDGIDAELRLVHREVMEVDQ